jgi:DNA-binding Lrp family transcriptional regulator
MRKHNGMRPQDIVILLKIMLLNGRKWTFAELANSLQLSEAEVFFAMERNKPAGLVSPDKSRVNKLALREFLIYGIKYVFPPQVGHSTRGIATAHSAPPLKEYISEVNEHFVWAYYKGTKRGNTIVPLYAKIPKIVINQPELYDFLTIIDTLRVGKKREIENAINELDIRMNQYE